MSRIATLTGRLALLMALLGAAALVGCKAQTPSTDGGDGKAGTKKEAPKDAPKDGGSKAGAEKLELVYYDIPG